jgi:hypothetical protein
MAIEKKVYWFKAKKYGWGWTPATWQGYIILGIYLIILLASFFYNTYTSDSINNTLRNFIPEVILYTLLLMFICKHTGESPQWRWGDKKSQ